MIITPQINSNIKNLKESATLAINMAAKAARKAGVDIAHLGFGQSPFQVHSKIQMALARNAHQKDYLPTKGLPQLCETIAQYHNKFFNYNFKPEDIIVGPGSKELIFQALYCLEGNVFVPAPSWVSYGPQINIKGERITPILTKVENDYKIQPHELEEALKKDQSDQKILIFNNPSNPTGVLYSPKEIEALAKVAQKYKLIIISDEIYALINFNQQPYSSFHHYYPEGTLVTSGLSKSHAAGGYRFGFLALPENMRPLLKAMCSLISETFSAVSAPTQFAALEAYGTDHELMTYINQCTKIHRACSTYLFERFTKMGAQVAKPEGAFYLFPQFLPFKERLKKVGILNDVQLSQTLFSDHHVATLPGSDFYFPENLYGLRIASVDYDGTYVYSKSLTPLALKGQVKLDHAFVEENCPQLKKGADRIENYLSSLP